MLKHRVLWSKCINLLIISFIVLTLSGCSSEYSTVGPKLEGSESITGGTMLLLAGLPGGRGTADATGNLARFNSPRGIVAYGDSIYVADKNNHNIRKLDISTNYVTTLAGYFGQAGVDDGVGIYARFNAPEGITTDGVYLYIADTQNHVIRKMDIDSSNVVTLAGKRGQMGTADGEGKNAQFNAPTGITIMGDYLFVADTDNNCIRKIDKNSGYTSTVAGYAGYSGANDGTGQAVRFYYPMDVASDGEYLFIADSYNHTIRSLDPATGEVFTLAGSAGAGGYADGSVSAARFFYPFGLEIKGSELFIAELGNDDVRVIDLTYWVVNTIAGTPQVIGSADGAIGVGQFNSPVDITVLGDSLYIADMENHSIREVNISTGEVETVAGYPPHPGTEDDIGENGRFYTPGGVVIDGDILYVADTYNHSIRKIDIPTGKVTTIAGTPGVSGSTDSSESPALFSSPGDVVIGENGTYIYIVDTDNHVIRSMNISSGEVRTFAGYPGITGYQDGIERNARFNSPGKGIMVGNALYVSDTGNHVIRKIDISTKTVTTVAGESGVAGGTDTMGTSDRIARFNTPGDLASDGAFLYVADTGNHAIRKIELSTGNVVTLVGSRGTSGLLDSIDGSPLFNSPEGIVLYNGMLYVSDTVNHVIRKIDLATRVVSFLAGDMSCIEESEVIDGNVKITKMCTGQPAGLSSYGDSTDGTGKTTSFRNPTGLSTDGTYLYVMDTGTSSIRRVDMSTGETKTLSFSKNKGVSLNAPAGGELVGNIFYIADKGNHIIRRLEITGLSGVPLITIAGNVGESGYRYSAGYSAKFNRPVGISVDGNGNLYVTDTGNHTLRKVVIATGEVTTVAGVPGTAGFVNSEFGYPLFNLPRGICIVGDLLYISDSGNHLIRRVNLTTGYVGLVAGLSDYVTNSGKPGTSDSTGAAAGFNDPRGITCEDAYLFVTDSGNHTIRRILRATGQVKTIAGMPEDAGYKDGIGFEARFNYPRGISVDKDYLYVADTGNSVFRRVNKYTGEILTFSGRKGESSFIPGSRNDARYNNVVSVTTAPYSPYLYFTDSAENIVGKIEKE